MSDAIFAFGQRGGYYFESPSMWKYDKLPDGLRALYIDNKVSQAYTVSLGAVNSYLISYEGKDGFDYLVSSGMPADLKSWLYEKNGSGGLARNLPSLRVSLGPNNDSYFAHDGSSYQWHNLPPLLESAIESRITPKTGLWIARPRIVSIGAINNFVLITAGNGGSWQLGGYPELEKLIQKLSECDGGLSHVQNVVLNPHRLNHAVIHAKNGGIVSTNNFKHAKADMDAIIASIKTAAVSEAAANSRRVVAQVRFNSPQAQMIRLQGQINEVRQMNRRAAFERMSQVDQMVAFMASMSVDFNTFRGL